jgi:hypothetical protein
MRDSRESSAPPSSSSKSHQTRRKFRPPHRNITSEPTRIANKPRGSATTSRTTRTYEARGGRTRNSGPVREERERAEQRGAAYTEERNCTRTKQQPGRQGSGGAVVRTVRMGKTNARARRHEGAMASSEVLASTQMSSFCSARSFLGDTDFQPCSSSQIPHRHPPTSYSQPRHL